MTNSPYLIALKERNAYTSNNTGGPRGSPEGPGEPLEFSPLSGSEPKFEPARWNNETIKYNHNCYSYVLNKIASKRSGKPQPGYFSNFKQLSDSDYNCAEFYKRLKKDIPAMYKIDFNTPCRKGFHKGFIAIDPKEEDKDYHFYRQDSSGYWSHKPGRNEAVDVDASNQKIKNPAKANRKYKYFDYSEPCFFFCVNSGLARTQS